MTLPVRQLRYCPHTVCVRVVEGVEFEFKGASRAHTGLSMSAQAEAMTLWVLARVSVVKPNADNSCLLRSSNSISDGVSRLSAGEVPSF
ncbi:hypothetical protein AwPolaro_05240 [Polaromonas sp.]|nr:hypothetical protein AwPolaro_05240 [Polaromonas sp.]